MTPTHDYPGGASAPLYRAAFRLWLVGFLGVALIAFVGYLGLRLHVWLGGS